MKRRKLSRRATALVLLAILAIPLTAAIAKSLVWDRDYDAGLYSYSKVYGFLGNPYSPGSAASYHYIVNTADLEQVNIVAYIVHISDTEEFRIYITLEPNTYISYSKSSSNTLTLIAESYAKAYSENGPIDSYAYVALP